MMKSIRILLTAIIMIASQMQCIADLLPVAPTKRPISRITDTTMTLQWGTNGNPDGTVYQCLPAPGGDVMGGQSRSTADMTQWTAESLRPGTKYAYKVLAGVLPIDSYCVYLDVKSTLPSYFYIGDREVQEGDYIAEQPEIELRVISTTIVESSAKMSVDLVSMPCTIRKAMTSSGEVSSIFFKTLSAILPGAHTLSFEVTDSGGTTYALSRAGIRVADEKTDKPVYIYPNPYNPNSTTKAVLAYFLPEEGAVSIFVYDLSGSPVDKRIIETTELEGAHSGYNEYPWDGMDGFGKPLGSDAYLIIIVQNGKIAGKGRVMILKDK